MNERKKPNAAKPKIEHRIRNGQIVAIATRKQTNSGYSFLDYSLVRVWQALSTGKENASEYFFAENEHDIIQCVREISEWIRQKSLAPATTTPDAPRAGQESDQA